MPPTLDPFTVKVSMTVTFWKRWQESKVILNNEWHKNEETMHKNRGFFMLHKGVIWSAFMCWLNRGAIASNHFDFFVVHFYSFMTSMSIVCRVTFSEAFWTWIHFWLIRKIVNFHSLLLLKYVVECSHSLVWMSIIHFYSRELKRCQKREIKISK